MKKVIASVAFVLTLGLVQTQAQSTDSSTQSTQSDTSRIKYEYYPEANVYYNDVSRNYWYYDSASSQWQSAAQLPSSYSINERSKKNTFYYNGGDVWKDNAKHMKTYGNKSKSKKPTKSGGQ